MKAHEQWADIAKRMTVLDITTQLQEIRKAQATHQLMLEAIVDMLTNVQCQLGIISANPNTPSWARVKDYTEESKKKLVELANKISEIYID